MKVLMTAPKLLLLSVLLVHSACDVTRTAASPGDGGAPPADVMDQRDWSTPADSRPDALAANCGTFTAFNSGKRVATFQTRQAFISPTLNRAWLLGHRDNADGDLYEVKLPSGKLTKVAVNVRAISQQGNAGALLQTRITDKARGHHDLYHIDAGAVGSKLLARKVCAYQSTGGDKTVALLSECAGSVGRLDLLDLPSGKIIKVDDNVGVQDFHLSPDATLLAYMVSEKITKDCFSMSGQFRLRSLVTGKTERYVSDVRPGSLQFLPHGRGVLFRQVISCNPSVEVLREVVVGTTGAVKLAALPSYGFYGHMDRVTGRYSYAVSPDSKWVLAAELDMKKGKENHLHQISTQNGAKTSITTNLYPYQMVSLAFTVYDFTADGKHVVFAADGAYPAMGLSAVPSLGSKARELSKAMPAAAFLVSNHGGRVAHMEGGFGGPSSLWVTDLNSSAKGKKLFSSGYALRGLSWVPDDRGLLWTEQAQAGQSTLRYVGNAGGTPTILGSWKTQYWQGQRAYALDRAGCLALYNQHQVNQPGTYLRRLPR